MFSTKNLYEIINLPRDSELYRNYVQMISNRNDLLHETIEKYFMLETWFRTAEIDIIDFRQSRVPDYFLKLLTGCKKIIIDAELITEKTEKILTARGVKIVKS